MLTLIAPGLYGKFIEEQKQVKLKIYNPSIDGPLVKKSIESQGEREAGALIDTKDRLSLSKGTVIMLLLFMIILALFVVLIFLSW